MLFGLLTWGLSNKESPMVREEPKLEGVDIGNDFSGRSLGYLIFRGISVQNPSPGRLEGLNYDKRN